MGQDAPHPQDHGARALAPGGGHDAPPRHRLRSRRPQDVQRLLHRAVPRPPRGSDQGRHNPHQDQRGRAGIAPGGNRARHGGIGDHASSGRGMAPGVRQDGVRSLRGHGRPCSRKTRRIRIEELRPHVRVHGGLHLRTVRDIVQHPEGGRGRDPREAGGEGRGHRLQVPAEAVRRAEDPMGMLGRSDAMEKNGCREGPRHPGMFATVSCGRR